MKMYTGDSTIAYMVLVLYLNPFDFVLNFQVSICCWVFIPHFKLHGVEGIMAGVQGQGSRVWM